MRFECESDSCLCQLMYCFYCRLNGVVCLWFSSSESAHQVDRIRTHPPPAEKSLLDATMPVCLMPVLYDCDLKRKNEKQSAAWKIYCCAQTFGGSKLERNFFHSWGFFSFLFPFTTAFNAAILQFPFSSVTWNVLITSLITSAVLWNPNP